MLVYTFTVYAATGIPTSYSIDLSQINDNNIMYSMDT